MIAPPFHIYDHRAVSCLHSEVSARSRSRTSARASYGNAPPDAGRNADTVQNGGHEFGRGDHRIVPCVNLEIPPSPVKRLACIRGKPFPHSSLVAAAPDVGAERIRRRGKPSSTITKA